MRSHAFTAPLFAALLTLVVGCSSRGGGKDDPGPGADAVVQETDGTPGEETSDADGMPWMSGELVGAGVAYKEWPNATGRGAAVLYAGYGVDLAGAEAWADALYRAGLRDRGVRHVWAVQGPSTLNYAKREIANSKIASALVRAVSAGAPYVVVVAHSSGSFVAHEMLTSLASYGDPANVTAGKIVYFDLDGASWGLSRATVAHLRRAWFVGVRDATTGTAGMNGAVMKQAGARLGGGYLEIDASGSGCAAGASDCVHMSMINARPHDPANADVAADYHAFDAAHPVGTAWLAAKGDASGIVPDL